MKISKSVKSFFICLLILLSYNVSSQNTKNISFHGGLDYISTISKHVRVSDYSNSSIGKPQLSFEFGTKTKFSNHFSFLIEYLRMKNKIRSSFNDLGIYYFNHYSQTGGKVGEISFTDDIYLTANQWNLGFNYEFPFRKNNFIITIGASRVNYNINKNYITRQYTSLPPNSSFSDLEINQKSTLSGTKIVAANIQIKYERYFFKERIGFYSKLAFYYYFTNSNYEYTHSTMGLDDSYTYKNGNQSFSYNKYYTFSINTCVLSVGLFYKLNFRKPNDNK